jgi:hypothetical protein
MDYNYNDIYSHIFLSDIKNNRNIYSLNRKLSFNKYIIDKFNLN